MGARSCREVGSGHARVASDPEVSTRPVANELFSFQFGVMGKTPLATRRSERTRARTRRTPLSAPHVTTHASGEPFLVPSRDGPKAHAVADASGAAWHHRVCARGALLAKERSSTCKCWLASAEVGRRWMGERRRRGGSAARAIWTGMADLFACQNGRRITCRACRSRVCCHCTVYAARR